VVSELRFSDPGFWPISLSELYFLSWPLANRPLVKFLLPWQRNYWLLATSTVFQSFSDRLVIDHYWPLVIQYLDSIKTEVILLQK
jgi:hypothetical protein